MKGDITRNQLIAMGMLMLFVLALLALMFYAAGQVPPAQIASPSPSPDTTILFAQGGLPAGTPL